MNNKGFVDLETGVKTSNDTVNAQEPLNSKKNLSKRVDINVLKSKLQELETKAFRKNIIILSILIIALAILGIYLSL